MKTKSIEYQMKSLYNKGHFVFVGLNEIVKLIYYNFTHDLLESYVRRIWDLYYQCFVGNAKSIGL